MLPRLRWKSVRTPLLLLVPLFVAPLVLLQAWNLMQEREERQSFIEHDALHALQTFATAQDHMFDSAAQTLAALAQLPAVVDGDSSRCEAALRRLRDEISFYTDLLVASIEGDVWCSTRSLTEPLNVASRPYFRGATMGRTVSVSPYLLGLSTGTPITVVGYPVVGPQDDLRGVIAATFSLDWFNGIVEELELPESTTVKLVGADGTVLAAHRDPAATVGSRLPEDFLAVVRPGRAGSVTARGEGLGGEARLFVSSPLSDLLPGVFLTIGIPAEVAFEGANREFLRNLAILVIGGLLLLAALLLGANRLILVRIDKLVEASQRLSSGDLEARSGLLHGPDEVGRLSAAFDAMAHALQAQREELRQSEERHRALVAALHEGVIMQTSNGEVMALNESAERILGLTHQEIMSRATDDPRWNVTHADGSPFTPETNPALITLRTGEPQTGVILRVEKPTGETTWVSLNTRPIFGSGTRTPEAVVSSFDDISRRKEAEEALAHQALHDPLTGLPNRMLFQDHLQRALSQAKRTNEAVAVGFLDLDGFKQVNDLLGHVAGDELLKEMAVRLQGCVREGDTVARLGGDEFTLILRHVQGREGVVEVARRILASFEEPFNVTGRTVQATLSLGFALAPHDGHDVSSLLRAADEAVYRAKDAGKGTYRFHSDDRGEAGSSKGRIVGEADEDRTGPI